MLHTSISPVSPPFSCAQNGISLLKEIFFLPQRNFPAGGKRRKTGLRRPFSFQTGLPGTQNPGDIPTSRPALRLTPARTPGAQASRTPGKKKASPTLALPSCISQRAKYAAFPAPSRPCLQTSESRDDPPGVLTLCHPGNHRKKAAASFFCLNVARVSQKSCNFAARKRKDAGVVDRAALEMR